MSDTILVNQGQAAYCLLPKSVVKYLPEAGKNELSALIYLLTLDQPAISLFSRLPAPSWG